MRRALAWAVAVPLMVAGSQVAHLLAYMWAYPSAPVRVRELLATGHSYLDWAPLLGGVGASAVAVSLLLTAADAARGRSERGLPAWAFALLPPLGFVVQEHLERFFVTGSFPWHAAAEPTFLPGLLLQLPFAAAAFAVARFLLRAAVRIGAAVARRARPRLRPLAVARPAVIRTAPRVGVLALRRAERGPPLAFVA